MEHTPVMVEPVFRFLVTESGGFYVDGTVGLGGHTEYLLKNSGDELRVLGIDRDPKALASAAVRLKPFEDRVKLKLGNFMEIKRFCRGQKVSGIILDLGLSSLQISDKERGFSYMHDRELDMNMGCGGGSVCKLIANAGEREIDRIISEFGEERRHRAITRKIVKMRRSRAILRTSHLREAVGEAVPSRYLIGALSRTFQAFRIWANSELESLRFFLPSAVEVLKTGGRLVIISYHSLEDRIVKHFFKREEKGCICPPDFPQCACGRTPTLKIITRKPERPSKTEVEENVRSRSAKLRVAERI